MGTEWTYVLLSACLPNIRMSKSPEQLYAFCVTLVRSTCYGIGEELMARVLLRAPTLSFVNYDNFGEKIKRTTHNKQLFEYHDMTKYRLEIAEYSLKLMFDNYENDIAFVAGLTAFLIQAKAALDSLCQEINAYYESNHGNGRDYISGTEDATNPNNILDLSKKNAELSQFLVRELGEGSHWFGTFKILHNSEGVHKRRSLSLIRPLVIAARDLEVWDMKVIDFCVESLSRIIKITESSYDLMS